MNGSLFIGIDIGTQGTKTALCTADGKTLAEAFSPSFQEHPEKGAVAESPDRIYSSVIETIRSVMEKSGASPSQVKGIAADSQMAGIMGIDDGFNAATYLDSWLDSRCSDYTELLRREAGDTCVALSGGQIMNTHAAKILWWKNERPVAYGRVKKFVMPNGYVAGKLCGLKADDAFMDYTFLHFNNFSDNKRLCFNDAMLSQFGVEKEKLPRVVSPLECVGTLTSDAAAACGLCTGTKVFAGCGDTAASSLGAGITRPGLAYDVAGTASVFACCCSDFVPDTRTKTLLFSRSVIEGLFLPLAYVTGGGLTLKWFSGICGKDFKTLDALAEKTEAGCGGVTFIPHFSGRTCPLDNSATGAFMGLREETGCGEMFRAVLESIAFEYRSYLDIMLESGCVSSVSAVTGVGGGAKSSIFSQIKADVLGADYIASEHICSAQGAMARLAAFSAGETGGTLEQQFMSAGGINYNFDTERHAGYGAAAELYNKRIRDYLR